MSLLKYHAIINESILFIYNFVLNDTFSKTKIIFENWIILHKNRKYVSCKHCYTCNNTKACVSIFVSITNT